LNIHWFSSRTLFPTGTRKVHPLEGAALLMTINPLPLLGTLARPHTQLDYQHPFAPFGTPHTCYVQVSDKKLRKYNLYACILHSVQGILMLVASQAVDSIKSFKRELTTSFLV
jgi:hypothetical protein